MTTTPAHALNNGRCEKSGKNRYFTRKDAKKAARTFHPNVALRAYQCGNHWHYGHTPQRVVRGETR